LLTETKTFEIHHYEIDLKKRAMVTKIMNYFDDTAITQSEKTGLGLDVLGSRNLTWVLYQWNIKMHEYPAYRDVIKVWTAPTGFNGFYAYRKYCIYNAEEKVISEADSIWFLVDTVKKRPVKVPIDVYEAYGLTSEGGEFIEHLKILPPERQDFASEFTVRYNDIDTNEHVNNARYVDWSIDALPEGFFLDHTLTGLKITYKKEVRPGERVVTIAQIDENNGSGVKTKHKVSDINGNILCLLEIMWLSPGEDKAISPRVW
jgi:medium-chain acyl-[acyl-carrier-protein] hydrolase